MPVPTRIYDANLYPDPRSKEVDDIVYEVDCSMIVVKPGADIDIGMPHLTMRSEVIVDRKMCIIGANPSAEEQEEALQEEGATTVNNVVHSFRLQSTQFDKKSYLTFLKVSAHHQRELAWPPY